MQRNIKLIVLMSIIYVFMLNVVSCGSETDKATETEKEEEVEQELDPMKNKGIGPITHVELDEELDEEMIAKGKNIFQSKCESCHHIETRYVGPPIGGITQRRTPEWIMNMTLNPAEMLEKDPIARALLAEYMVQMAYQNVTEEDVRAILEYFRKIDREGDFEN